MSQVARPWGDAKIIPLVVIDDPADTLPIMDALLEGGLDVIEIGLRTPAALKAVEIAAQNETMKVAAGTVVNTAQLKRVIDLGASFGISPAWSDAVVAEAQRINFPFIPAIATPTEALRAFENGYTQLKVYPADLLGAEKFIRAIGAVFPDLSLVPSGGVGPHNAGDLLREPNVFAVSGSWITPKRLIEERNFEAITRLATEALAIANG